MQWLAHAMSYLDYFHMVIGKEFFFRNKEIMAKEYLVNFDLIASASLECSMCDMPAYCTRLLVVGFRKRVSLFFVSRLSPNKSLLFRVSLVINKKLVITFLLFLIKNSKFNSSPSLTNYLIIYQI